MRGKGQRSASPGFPRKKGESPPKPPPEQQKSCGTQPGSCRSPEPEFQPGSWLGDAAPGEGEYSRSSLLPLRTFPPRTLPPSPAMFSPRDERERDEILQGNFMGGFPPWWILWGFPSWCGIRGGKRCLKPRFWPQTELSASKPCLNLQKPPILASKPRLQPRSRAFNSL